MLIDKNWRRSLKPLSPDCRIYSTKHDIYSACPVQLLLYSKAHMMGQYLIHCHLRGLAVAHAQSSQLQELSFSNGVYCHCFMQLMWATTLSAAPNQINFLTWWVGKRYRKKPWAIVSFKIEVASFFSPLSSTCPQCHFKDFWVKSSDNDDCLVDRPFLIIKRWTLKSSFFRRSSLSFMENR